MLIYELNKSLAKTSTKVLLVLMTIILIMLSAYSIFSAHYVLKDGTHTLYGIEAIERMKKEKSKWNGPLDEDAIKKVIDENNQINTIYDPYSTDVVESQKGYSLKQSFMDIRNMLNSSFCGFQDFDYYVADRLAPEDAINFYPNRQENFKEWLEGEGKDYYSTQEGAYYLQQYKNMPTPLTYSYQDGWNKVFSSSAYLLYFTVVIICLIVASIFSQEFTTKSYSILLSTKYGRTKAIRTKVLCGLIITLLIYTIVIGLYSLIVLGVYGFDGYDCLIQSNNGIGLSGWKSIYYITNLEAYAWIFGSGLIGTLFISILTMLVSCKLKSTMFASVIAFLMIILPDWIGGFVNLPIVNNFFDLFPDQLMITSRNLLMLNRIELGDLFISPIWIMCVMYLILGFVLCQWILQSSKKLYM